MKNVTYGLFAFSLALLIMQGCQKSQIAALKGQLVAKKLTLKINEPDSLILVGAAADSVLWSVTPAGFNTLLKVKNKAVVTFNKAGSYTVSASANGGTPATVTITVNDSVYVPQPVYTFTPYNSGEQITLLPSYYKSKNGDTTYMYFMAQTTKSYPCGNSTMVFTKSVNENNLGINFLGINQVDAGSCQIPNSHLTSQKIYFFYQGTTLSFNPGTYPLTVTLNGTTYTGSIVIAVNGITFNWDYTSGVIISPKYISR
ncbi:MAG: hypothetical protein JWQ79_1046 [Mucilaginibacter sp.]|jgi:hypothetical protein|nr:hypothetical protein [Mucilaginibacter sp.]